MHNALLEHMFMHQYYHVPLEYCAQEICCVQKGALVGRKWPSRDQSGEPSATPPTPSSPTNSLWRDVVQRWCGLVTVCTQWCKTCSCSTPELVHDVIHTPRPFGAFCTCSPPCCSGVVIGTEMLLPTHLLVMHSAHQ